MAKGILEENKWLNVQIVEQKFQNLERLGIWQEELIVKG